MATIVIAEDEYLLGMLLSTLLEDAGHEVKMAPHGLAALKLVRQHHPDLVITDFMMPLMTGLELAEAIRRDDAIAHIPIILVSGAQGSIGRERPEMFEAVLDKPYPFARLMETVEELLASGR